MRQRLLKYILWSFLFLFGVGLYAMNANLSSAIYAFQPEVPEAPQDTLRFPVSRTAPLEYEDIVKQSPADLRDPENVKTSIEYDIRTGSYVVRTKIGDMEINTPLTLTPEEYQNYSIQQSLRSYFRQKNVDEFEKEANGEFNLLDMQFGLGAGERLFGPGGVRVRTQGSADITMGLKNNTTKDPSLPERARSRTFFNFDENIQLNVQASVGSKVNFDMNYNTQTSFDFDSKKLNLAYQGEEDEIIKNIEAGNVSMTTNNSLIRGGAALFGIKADLQFGKLRVNTLLAQQESESKTVSSNGGVQTKPFELTVDQYDENRHFFLSHYFRDVYDDALKSLPYINSPVNINKVEVWITNKRGNFDQARNIVSFSDLGEHDVIGNTNLVKPEGSSKYPSNRANNLYNFLIEQQEARKIGQATKTLTGLGFEGGKDFEKLESARRLDETEFTFHAQLGYISLRTQLQPDEVLAVAYEFKIGSTSYQVGEFSTDNINEDAAACLFVKTLKGTTPSPRMPYWDLMMKNIYSLGAYSVQKEKFQFNILYQSDTTGVYINSLPGGVKKDTLLLRVMNLDRLDSRDSRNPDGFFDFVNGITVQAETGRVIFPVVEPFGSNMRKQGIEERYIFQELYDSTLTVARQIAEKNKYIFRGEYKASSGAEIQLGATNVARGSVVVTAGGAILTENTDYTVDYMSGVVTILNESIIASNTPISVSLENQSMYNMQRKTMMGLDMNYQFNKDFSLGATIMHMSEMPLTVKTSIGDESIKNTLWGLNTSYKTESQWLTNMLDKLPLLTLTKPSQISFNAEFAHLIAGHYENKYTGSHSYLDDFESTQSGFNLLNPYSWQLASTPFQDSEPVLFREANRSNDISYGMNRSLLAWYYIDGLFTRRNSSNYPGINKDSLANHNVRPIDVSELFPNKQLGMSEASTLSVLNVAYYPNERGPYNLDAENVNPDGTLGNPEQRWGGMMRRIEQSDFETANIEYIQFWLLDPFLEEQGLAKGGDLYFNLGEISEDILKDEKKFYENGLPLDTDPAKISEKVEETVWGRVPKQQSTVYAFDNTANARERQDVGLNGLSYKEEQSFPTYVEYMNKLRSRLSQETITRMENDVYSPLVSPAGDRYIYYRDEYYDQREAGILERYKRYNGTEGNSQESTGRYQTASKTVPDVEDINQDYTLNENEKYYEYKVSLRREDLRVGHNYITDIRQVDSLLLPNNTRGSSRWYLFKIPVKNFNRTIGGISDFKSIRFMRMYLTQFEKPVVLRFGTFELVRGEWRVYEQSLSNPSMPPATKGMLNVASVNIEENGDYQEGKPLNYVLPPGVNRMFDASQPQLRQENEQALSLTVNNLSPLDALAIYKTTNYDLRQYKRIQLFTHAHRLMEDTQLEHSDLTVFMRLGSDYKNNYYEYEVPLTLTAHGKYSNRSTSDQRKVWPEENELSFKLEILTDLKLKRNRLKRAGEPGVDYQTVFSGEDPDNKRNTISIVGNPSLAEVKTIMIGVRNNSGTIKSGEVWINELRLTEFNEEGGWAANANLSVALSDLGTVNASGRIETAGFGSLDQSLMERRLDDFKQFSVSTNLELGKFFPEKAKVSIPLYYAYSKETISPKYNPLDQDIKLSEALDVVETKAEKDSIRSYSQDMTTNKSFALNNVRVDIRSKNPMPYDPANFSFGYAFRESSKRNPETEYETEKDYSGNFAYNYTPYVKPWRPFNKIKKNNGYTRYFKQLAINYLPATVAFQTSMMRNYYEIQLRDLVSNTTGGSNVPVSFSQNFSWDRAFSIRWNLTNSLNLSFSSGTNARIEEPHVQVNKKINADEYRLWKDSVMQSIRNLGTPMKYDQSFQATWTLPLQHIPILDWANSTIGYNATYNWDRGAITEDVEQEIGNVIRNQRQIDWQAGFNFQSLYNKSAYLKKVNQKYAQTTMASRTPEQKKPSKIVLDLTLNTDSGTIVEHKMFSKKVRLSARRLSNGKAFPIKYKILNFAQAEILNQDTVALKVTVVQAEQPVRATFIKAGEYSSRFLMMLRRFNIQYTQSDGMLLPGFRPEIGDVFGQKRTGILSPGLGFAFGDVRRGYIDDAVDRGWMVMNETNITPAVINYSTNLNVRADLEPISGLKINLNANRTSMKNTSVEYMLDGMPETQTGSFTITTISLKSAFKSSGNAGNEYASSTFEEFRKNIDIIAGRLENNFAGTTYPNKGFLTGTGFAGNSYNKANGEINKKSSDVLIPAFLAAYTGKSAKGIGLSSFPSLSSMLPNWRVTYEGLIQIPFFKKHFKSFMLSHQYRSTYAVGSYSTFQSWVQADGGDSGLGFIRNVQKDNPMPSSAYDISSVSLIENFSPLLGVDATLLNNMTGRVQYNKTRTLNLNVSSYQIVEALSDEIVVGLGYKLTEFNKVLKRKGSQNFSNDLTVRVDYSYRKMQSIIRKIEQGTLPQATSGNIAKTFQFSADYALSRALTLSAFYDLQMNEPLISNASYPTSNSNYGISIRFSLAQ